MVSAKLDTERVSNGLHNVDCTLTKIRSRVYLFLHVEDAS
jgi:hypothetical protein